MLSRINDRNQLGARAAAAVAREAGADALTCALIQIQCTDWSVYGPRAEKRRARAAIRRGAADPEMRAYFGWLARMLVMAGAQCFDRALDVLGCEKRHQRRLSEMNRHGWSDREIACREALIIIRLMRRRGLDGMLPVMIAMAAEPSPGATVHMPADTARRIMFGAER